MIGRKAMVVGGFNTEGKHDGMHSFHNEEIVTLQSIDEIMDDDGKNPETWYNFINEDGDIQSLVEYEFIFIKEGVE